MTTPAAGLPRVVAVINGKGGTFKTSIVSSLGGLLAQGSWRVLLVDLDPQGNLSEDLGLGEKTDEGRQQLDCVPTGRTFEPQPSGRENLDVVYGGPWLHDLHAIMQSRQVRDPQGWMHGLAQSLVGLKDEYDLVLIDCPPGNAVLQTLALVAARHVLIPTRSDASSRKGLREVARVFVSVRPFNEDIELLGVVRTGISTQSVRIRDEVRAEIDEDLGGVAPVFESCIRYSERPAKTVRDLGQLPHELQGQLATQKPWYARFKDGHKDEGPQIPESTSGLAQDYSNLAREFVKNLLLAEGRARHETA